MYKNKTDKKYCSRSKVGNKKSSSSSSKTWIIWLVAGLLLLILIIIVIIACLSKKDTGDSKYNNRESKGEMQNSSQSKNNSGS